MDTLSYLRQEGSFVRGLTLALSALMLLAGCRQEEVICRKGCNVRLSTERGVWRATGPVYRTRDGRYRFSIGPGDVIQIEASRSAAVIVEEISDSAATEEPAKE